MDPALIAHAEEGDGAERSCREELHGQNSVHLPDELHANWQGSLCHGSTKLEVIWEVVVLGAGFAHEGFCLIGWRRLRVACLLEAIARRCCAVFRVGRHDEDVNVAVFGGRDGVCCVMYRREKAPGFEKCRLDDALSSTCDLHRHAGKIALVIRRGTWK